jgi:hypothetical protein
MKATLEAINRMQVDGITGKYAIGGAVGATFYLEPSATVDIDILVSLKNPKESPLLTLAPIYDYLTSRGYKTEKEYAVPSRADLKVGATKPRGRDVGASGARPLAKCNSAPQRLPVIYPFKKAPKNILSKLLAWM